MNFIRNMNIKVRFTISYIIIIFTLIFGSSTLLVNMYNNILKVTNELNEQNHRFITNNIINKLVENHSFILSFNDIENISQITSTDNLYTLSELGAANQLRKLFLKPQFSKKNARFSKNILRKSKTSFRSDVSRHAFGKIIPTPICRFLP